MNKKPKKDRPQMTIPCIEDKNLRWKMREFCGKNKIYLKDFVYVSILSMARDQELISIEDFDKKMEKTIWNLDI